MSGKPEQEQEQEQGQEQEQQSRFKDRRDMLRYLAVKNQ